MRGHDQTDARVNAGSARWPRYGLALLWLSLAFQAHPAGVAAASTNSADQPAAEIERLTNALGEPGAPAAMLHNALGQAYMRLQDPIAASRHFRDASALADSRSRPRFQLNLARSLLARTRASEAADIVRKLEAELERQPLDLERATLRIGIGVFYRDYASFTDTPAMQQAAQNAWTLALRDAESLGDTRLQAYAHGLTGELHEARGQHEDSLRAARSAMLHAGSADALHRWEWLAARNHQRLGNSAAALAAYKRAIEAIRAIRPALETNPGFLRDTLAPIYQQYAQLLLDSLPENAGAQLAEARNIIEELKFAEVENYFGDQCMVPNYRTEELQNIDPGAVVIYPLVFDSHVALLVSSRSGLTEYRADIGRRDLEALITRFRSGLQSRSVAPDTLPTARALYDVLITPLEGTLAAHAPETIVFVPDGALRTIPIAALHDGDQYLIERYAIATSPGLTLTAPRSLRGDTAALFAGGLSEAVQGFRALRGVNLELDALGARYGVEPIRNDRFSTERVEQALRNGGYDIVHLATHGQFRGSYSESFLLTYGGRLSIDSLSQNIQTRENVSGPLELLVLSACETATGDDRAALGIAGLAMRAGARSALATLWAVDDAATARLIEVFYRELHGGGRSKAASLRQAQVELIRTDDFPDPTNWAPFLLIGNWL